MIEPGKNGRRSGSVAKGRCEAGCFVKNGRPLVRWILTDLRRAKHPRGRRAPDPAPAAADAVAEHLRKRSGGPVQTDLAKVGRRSDGGQRCRAVHVSPMPERRLIPLAPASMDTGIGSSVGGINLTTRFLRFVSFGRAALHASVTRGAASYGFHPQSVSFRPRDVVSQCPTRSSQRSLKGGVDTRASFVGSLMDRAGSTLSKEVFDVGREDDQEVADDSGGRGTGYAARRR